MDLNQFEQHILDTQVASTDYLKAGKKSMICVLTANNGFEQIGHASCLDPKMFNESIGQELALKDAIAKLGEHIAFTLQDKIQG